jgi:hypothetical protein
MEELKEGEVWISGAYSATVDQRVPHVVINEEWPQGRFTLELRQAWEWAHADAEHYKQTPQLAELATDWVGAVWAGVPPISPEVIDLRTEEDKLGRLLP